MNYLEWVDREIDKLQREIVKLTLAREVIVNANKALAPLNRVKLDKPVKKRAPKQARLDASRVRGIIMEVCGNARLAPKAIYAHVHAQMPEVTEKNVWNHLWRLKQDGRLNVTKEGYMVAIKAEQAA
jgi:hypothetical protein